MLGSGGVMLSTYAPAKTAEIYPAVATLDPSSGRLQPSLGGRRIVWRNVRGKETTAPPSQKNHTTKAGRGMVPAPHGRAYLNGTDSNSES